MTTFFFIVTLCYCVWTIWCVYGLILTAGLQTNLGAVVPLAERAATRGRVGLWRRLSLTLNLGLVLVRWCCFRVHRCWLGVVPACGRGVVALPWGCGLQAQWVTRFRGRAGCDGVPPQAAMDLVEVTPHVGFSGEGFEAHGAGFSGRCAESFLTTSNINKENNIYYFT